MKIVVLTITYNCADIIPFYLRHYETFADKIVIWDDSSTDGTREVLGRHPLVSLCDWIKVPGINEDLFLQHWQEEYPKLRGEFDWVMIPDSDEFLIPPLGVAMTAILEKAQEWDVVASMGFNLTGPSFPKDDGRQIYEINPMGVYAPVYSKPIVFKPHIQINWIRGRHALENCSPMVSPPMLKLLHARYFGREYTARRNAKNYERVGADKGTAWSCAPDYRGEHSAEWAQSIISKSVNVVA